MPTFRAAPVPTPRTQIALTERGLIAECDSPTSNTQVWTSQTVFASSLGLRAGDVVTNIVSCVSTSAIGTSATNVRLGLATSSGTMLAVTGVVNAASSWPLGYVETPLSAPYTITADGLYYAVTVKNGTWGTTDAVLLRPVNLHASLAGAIGTKPIKYGGWTGQTDLPAVGSALTLTAISGCPWLGVS